MKQPASEPVPEPARAAAEATPQKKSTGFGRQRLELPWPDLGKLPESVGGGEKDAAVIVAIEQYEHVPWVPGATSNADNWHSYFVKSLGIPDANMRRVPQTHATKEGILKALEDAAGAAQAGGRVWFVFIGHGAPSKSDGLLLGVDVRQNPESVEARGVRHGDVLKTLNKSKAQPVVVLDACFSGLTGSGEPIVGGIQPLLNVEAPDPGRAVVMTAAANDQYAGPLPGAPVPAFSYLALGALLGWGDANKDGRVSAFEVVNYAKSTMGPLLYGRDQTPKISGDKAAEPLVNGKETGPDITEFSKMLSQNKEDKLFNRNALVTGKLPELDLPELTRGAIVEGDEIPSKEEMLEREELFKALKKAKAKVDEARAVAAGDYSGEKQKKAWCELAEFEDPNPYKEEAKQACAQTASYVEQRKRIVASMDQDWERVETLTQLESYTADDKKRVLKAFARAYSVLEEQPRLLAAVYAYRELEKGRLLNLKAVEHGISSGSISTEGLLEVFNEEAEGPPEPAPPPVRETAKRDDVAPQPTEKPKNKKTRLGHAIFWPGLAVGGFGGVATELAESYGDKGCEVPSNCDKSRTWAGVMWVSYGVSLAAMGAGAALWVLGAKEKAAGMPGGTVALAPMFDSKSFTLSISGEW